MLVEVESGVSRFDIANRMLLCFLATKSALSPAEMQDDMHFLVLLIRKEFAASLSRVGIHMRPVCQARKALVT